MKKYLLNILVGKRKESATLVQKILTTWGCLIKTRLGIHDGVLDKCSDSGLIILELVGNKKKIDELTRKINLVRCVKAKLVQLEIN